MTLFFFTPILSKSSVMTLGLQITGSSLSLMTGQQTRAKAVYMMQHAGQVRLCERLVSQLAWPCVDGGPALQLRR